MIRPQKLFFPAFALAGLLGAPLKAEPLQPLTEAPILFQHACANRLDNFKVSLSAEQAVEGYERSAPGSPLAHKFTFPQNAEYSSYSDNFDIRYTVKTGEILSTGDMRHNCGRGEIELTVTPTQQIIQIPADFQKGSCHFKYIYEHQKSHIKANQDYLADILDDLNMSIRSAYGNNIVYAATPTGVEEHLHDFTVGRVLPYLHSRLNQVAPIHSHIDNQLVNSVFDVCGSIEG